MIDDLPSIVAKDSFSLVVHRQNLAKVLLTATHDDHAVFVFKVYLAILDSQVLLLHALRLQNLGDLQLGLTLLQLVVEAQRDEELVQVGNFQVAVVDRHQLLVLLFDLVKLLVNFASETEDLAYIDLFLAQLDPKALA